MITPKFHHTRELCYENEEGEVIMEEVMSKEDAISQFKEWVESLPIVTGRTWDNDPNYKLIVARADKIGAKDEFTARIFNVEEVASDLSKVGNYLN